VVFSLRILV